MKLLVKATDCGAGEMDQHQVLLTGPTFSSLYPHSGSQMSNSSSREPNTLFWPLRTPRTHVVRIHTKLYTYNFKENLKVTISGLFKENNIEESGEKLGKDEECD